MRKLVFNFKCNESIVEERFYPAPQDPYVVINMVNTMDDNALAEITPG